MIKHTDKHTEEFKQEAVRIALPNGLSRDGLSLSYGRSRVKSVP